MATALSEAQTRAILDAQRRRAATVVAPTHQAIVARHQAAQRLLQPTTMIIPFAERLAFPTDHTRTRRDHQRRLDLVDVVAFLHQYQRQQGQAHGIAFIEAVPDDYELAAQLLQRCLGYAFDDLSPKARELYACVQRLVREHHQTTVTRGDICRWTGWRLAQVRKLLDQLTELGYVRALKGSKGQQYVYKLIESPQLGSTWSSGLLALDKASANGAPRNVDGTRDAGQPSDGPAEAVDACVVQT